MLPFLRNLLRQYKFHKFGTVSDAIHTRFFQLSEKVNLCILSRLFLGGPPGLDFKTHSLTLFSPLIIRLCWLMQQSFKEPFPKDFLSKNDGKTLSKTVKNAIRALT